MRTNFDEALSPAAVLFRPSEPRFLPQNRRWQGIASMTCTPTGTLYAVFYSGGVTEQQGNFCVVCRSEDGGASWTDPLWTVAHPSGQVRCFDPNVWTDPDGRLWLFWTQSYGFYDGRCGVWCAVCPDPDADCPHLSDPRRIADGLMMNKPTVLQDGGWLFPIAVWDWMSATVPLGTPDNKRTIPRVSGVYLSRDRGETFTFLGGADVPNRCFDEHMVVERADSSLWMLVWRLDGIGESFSLDGGRSWTPGVKSPIEGPCSRFFIRRLRSGRLLLVNHLRFSGRNNLAAQLSEDDGRTWLGGLMLDPRPDVSYPDGAESEDGRIYIVHDRERYAAREVLMSVFREEDVLAGGPVSGDMRLCVPVSRAEGPLPPAF